MRLGNDFRIGDVSNARSVLCITNIGMFEHHAGYGENRNITVVVLKITCWLEAPYTHYICGMATADGKYK